MISSLNSSEFPNTKVSRPPSLSMLEGEDSGNGSSPVSPPNAQNRRSSIPLNSSVECQCPKDVEDHEPFSSKVSPMAFTVDFGGSSLGISDSISKFAPMRHRRNLSLSKIERKEQSSLSGGSLDRTPYSKKPLLKSPSSQPKMSAERSEWYQDVAPPSKDSPKQSFCDGEEEERKSGTGTYTLELEESEVSGPRSIDALLGTKKMEEKEWVREWAESASIEVQKKRPATSGGRSEREASPGTQCPVPRRRTGTADCRGEVIGYVPACGTRGRLSRESSGHSASFGLRREEEQRRERDQRVIKARTPTQESTRIPLRERSPGRKSAEKSHSPSNFLRSDGGRFSLRAPKPISTPPTQIPVGTERRVISGSGLQKLSEPKNRDKSPVKKSATGIKKVLLSGGKRSQSTLSPKEVELANWNRRKTYDPLKAAALDRRKDQGRNETQSKDQGRNETQSKDQGRNETQSKDQGRNETQSKDQGRNETQMKDHKEPGQRINPDGAASVHKSPTLSFQGLSSEEDLYERPEAMDELHHSPQRNRNKLQALDTLVIATIHSLSNRVRTASRILLQKLLVDGRDDENGALLEEMVSQLKELETASPNKGSSRELSGTLKNLKKIEQVILVLDRILCGENEDF